MAWKDLHPFQPAISADLAQLMPLGDFVLVEPLSSDDELKLESFAGEGDKPVVLFSPGVHETKDGRWRQDRPRGNRLGRVVAVGKGDQMVGLYCADCLAVSLRVVRSDTDHKRGVCECGGRRLTLANGDLVAHVERAEMYVKAGDVVLFPRVPANEITINDREYVFLHHEQHVLAVIEEQAA